MLDYDKKLDIILQAVKNEVLRSNKCHPTTYASPHEGYAIIKEELEELWHEVKRDDIKNMSKESIQLACTVIKNLLSFKNYEKRLEKRNEERNNL